MVWYYKAGSREAGPISKAQLAHLLRTGRIDGKTLVRHVGMHEWRSLAEMVNAGGQQRESEPSSKAPAGAKPPPPLRPLTPPAAGAPSGPFSEVLLPFAFKGSGTGYFKVWIVNVLLTIITLGIYSAWAKVRRKQYFYGNTQVAGSAFHYLADPIKILKGRAVVLAGFIAYIVAGKLYPLVGYVIMVLFLLLLPWLVVRSLVFNARNSAVRNLRFNFTGTYRAAAKAFLLYPALVPFTLGVLLPYTIYRQKKFVVEGYAYGTTAFTFHAGARGYYRIFAAFLLPLTIVLALAVVLGYGAIQAWVTVSSALTTGVLLVATLYLYGFAYFGVKSSNLLFNSSALLSHRFRATMKVPTYGLIVLTNTLATVLTLGLFHPFAKVRAYGYRIGQLALLSGGDLDGFVAAEMKEVSALGQEVSDFMDFDFGI